jgi:hypothetical protein
MGGQPRPQLGAGVAGGAPLGGTVDQRPAERLHHLTQPQPHRGGAQDRVEPGDGDRDVRAGQAV